MIPQKFLSDIFVYTYDISYPYDSRFFLHTFCAENKFFEVYAHIWHIVMTGFCEFRPNSQNQHLLQHYICCASCVQINFDH